jgi:hypothetical protein
MYCFPAAIIESLQILAQRRAKRGDGGPAESELPTLSLVIEKTDKTALL